MLEGSGRAERQEGFAAVVAMNISSQPLQERGLGESSCRRMAHTRAQATDS